MGKFVQFYSDPSLTGHMLLKPSLTAVKWGNHIISPIESPGVMHALGEVLKRVFLAVIIFFILLASIILVPIGLSTKCISFFLSSNKDNKQDPPISNHPQSFDPASGDAAPNQLDHDQDSTQPFAFIDPGPIDPNREQLDNVADQGDCLYLCLIDRLIMENLIVVGNYSSQTEAQTRAVQILRSKLAETIESTMDTDPTLQEYLRNSLFNYYESVKTQKQETYDNLITAYQLQDDDHQQNGICPSEEDRINRKKQLELASQELEQAKKDNDIDFFNGDFNTVIKPRALYYTKRIREQFFHGDLAESYAFMLTYRLPIQVICGNYHVNIYNEKCRQVDFYRLRSRNKHYQPFLQRAQVING